jgi:eukaryotic-like serine/threonine-protein kinase
MEAHLSHAPTPDQPVPFGRYELLELVGEGAMAQVYRARQSGPMGFSKQVAIKRLRTGSTRRDRKELESLVNEARLGGQLRHPHLVEVYGCDVHDGSFFIAMEFVEGWTLDDVIWTFVEQGQDIPLVAVLDMLRQLARGLAYAHSAEDQDGQPMNLVHRDLKPQNIFLDRRGVVKIADFGLAKSTANLYQTTEADVTKGSPLYMSPEQVEGASLDRRSDLFAVGSLIIELVTGLRAFEGNSVANTLRKVLDADYREPWEPFARTAPVLVPVVQRLLALNREDRYPDADSLARELDSLVAGDAIGLQTKALAGVMLGEAPKGLPPALWQSWAGVGVQLGTLTPTAAGALAPTEPLEDDPAADSRISASASFVAEAWESSPTSVVILVALCVVLTVAIGWLSWSLLATTTTPVSAPAATVEALPEPGADLPVSHTAAKEARAYSDLRLRVKALDGAPRSPRLRYRKAGTSTWRSVAMEGIGEDVYEATVPVVQDAGTTMEYYLEVAGGTLGAPARPFRVPVR